MPFFRLIVVLDVMFTVVSARWLKGRNGAESLQMPQETGTQPVLVPSAGPPKPTKAPLLNIFRQQLKRDDTQHTCAYFDTAPYSWAVSCGSPYWCAFGYSTPYAGCCSDANNCYATTTCLDFTASVMASNALYCPSSQPYCVYYIYASNDPYYPGYTDFGCHTVRATYTIIHEFPGGISSSSSTTPWSTTSSTTPNSASTSSIDYSPPVGAIVGGVVGGLAVLAIIGGMVAFFILQSKKNKQGSAPGNSAAAPSGPPSADPFPQGQYAEMAGAPLIEKPPQGYPTVSHSPYPDSRTNSVASPYPGSPAPMYEPNSPLGPLAGSHPPNMPIYNHIYPQAQQYNQAVLPPPQQVNSSVSQNADTPYPHAVELTAENMDTEPRELPCDRLS